MGGFQPNIGGAAFVMRLQEPRGAEAPLIAGFQPGKAKLRAWGRQVIAQIFRKGQEFGGNRHADSMAALILGAGVAVAVAEIAGYGC